MTTEEKNSELQRYRDILLATIDYLLDRFGGSFVVDQLDMTAEFYTQQKAQTLKNYKQRRLDRLQQRLKSLTKALQNEVDLNFATHIKEKTGFELDLFEDLKKRVDHILTLNEIRSEQELYDISTWLRYRQQESADGEVVDKLKVLLSNYHNRTHDTAKSGVARKRKSGYSETVSREVKGDIETITITISTGPKPKHWEEQVVVSPDGKRRLRITQSGDKHSASTCVVLEFPNSSGGIYGIQGIRPDVKAFWKDNHTVVIETKKEYETGMLHRKVSSYGDVIAIEYIEH